MGNTSDGPPHWSLHGAATSGSGEKPTTYILSIDFALLPSSVHQVELGIKQLEASSQPIENMYFREMGVASVVAP